jgi:DNA-binding CsgD family transcriptional regulator
MTKTYVQVLASITCLSTLSLMVALTGCAGGQYNQRTDHRIDHNCVAERSCDPETDQLIEDSHTAERAREVLGYLLKRAATIELPEAFNSVVGGEIYLSREISGRFLKKLPLQKVARAIGPLEQLTPRQREILQLLAEGQTTKAVALVLKLSNKTVEYHRAKLMARLDIFDIPGLVRFALRSGLISQES